MLILSNSAPAAPVDTPDGLPKFPSLDNSYGAVLLGTYFGLILFGLTAHQAWRYFGMYPKDRRALKVTVVMLAETLTSALTVHICYYYLVENYFNPSALRVGTWSLRINPIAAGVNVVLTQRIWLIAPRCRVIVVVVIVLCLAELGFLIAATVINFIVPDFKGFENSLAPRLISVHLITAFVADTLLTSVLILVLHESRTGFQRTDSMINRMITYSVNTGLLTGIMTLLSFIFSINDVDNFIWIGISMVGTKMYAITLLSALNSRQSIASRVSGAANDITPLGISGTSFQNPHDSTILAHRSHASQLRPTRTAEEVVSVIELKAIFKSSASSKASNAGATIVGFALPDSAHMGLPNRYAFEYHSV